MGIRKWNEAQRKGIQAPGGSLLVSAAAGSGKTTVLAERCVYLVCDAKPLCGVDELLVVTFTEAAAAEMKDRIHRALERRQAEKPSRHIEKQIAVVDRANISTLHGFCARVLRQHFHLLGLDPNFAIMDGDEAKLLRLEVARDLFAQRFDREEGSEDFRRFVDCYGDGDDERLVELVIGTHEMLSSVADPAWWRQWAMDRLTEAIERPLGETELGQEYGRSVGQELVAVRRLCETAVSELEKLKNFAVYVEHLRELWTVINHWISVFESHGMDGLVDVAGEVVLPRLPAVSSKIEGKEAAKARVDAVAKAMKDGGWRQCLRFTEREWKEGLRETLPHAEIFLTLVEEFGDFYAKAKEAERALDFSDLERLTLKILRGPSAVALAYHKQFKHVLVDEYQDINEVQDEILTLLSTECRVDLAGNLFCVGDVKQSIYRFRLAEAKRFLMRKERNARKKDGVIDLQENFRSRGRLLEAINGVFERLMSKESAGLDYDLSQRLVSPKGSRDWPTNQCFSGAPIELHLLTKETQQDEEAVDLDRTQREAVLLGRRILEITGRSGKPAMHIADGETTRPVRFGDIVILLRSMRFKADEFAMTLRDGGIAVHSESRTGYFEATEINDLLSLLALLDNARQDVPLATVLRSPLGGFDEECLARIRLGDAEETFHLAVMKYAREQTDDLAERLRNFFTRIEHWRQLARRRPLAEVIWTIFQESGYLAFCCGLPDGQQRGANLIGLHERARQFGSFRRQGLGRFLQFLEKLKADSDLGQESVASEADDAVRIMSVHRSKGLEFPVVMLADLGKAINLSDSHGMILMDREAGLGLAVVDEARCVKYPSLAWTVVRERIREQAMAEELRVLYVAMTRAKEHLILVGTCSEKRIDSWASQWTGHRGKMPAEDVLGARCMLDWLGAVAAMSSGVLEMTVHGAEQVAAWSVQEKSAITVELAELKPISPMPEKSMAVEDLVARLGFAYPQQKLAETAATQSVTSATKGNWQPQGTSGDVDRILPKPGFLEDGSILNAADRGTATHAVLEHLDFSDAKDLVAIHRQVAAMVSSGRITPVQAESVDLAAIEWLMQQDVGSLLRENSEKLLREVPVYFAMDSEAGSTDPMDQIMIRGRLDLLIPVGDGFVIVDYKTDRVRGEELEQRAEMYRDQLQLYGQAIERITGKKVVQTILVFLHPKEIRRLES
jgi:ATP-dependent helicase/nuclease subunit A